MSHPRPLLALAPLLLAAGCPIFEEHHSFKDQGRICLMPESLQNGSFTPTSPQTYVADQRLFIRVVLPTCSSSSCSNGRRAECSAKLQGTTLQVTSHGSFNEERWGLCTGDCVLLVARCLGPPLPAGTYQIKHGDSTLSLTVPSTVTAPCAGDGWPL
jgi:hypothetical protein